MKNFERIAEGLNVVPLLNALKQMPDLWREITLRQEYPGSAHHDTEAIVIRGPKSFSNEDYFCDFSALSYPAAVILDDQITPLIWPVLQALQVKELGRLFIIKLKPHGIVDLHIDEGDYADHYSRFHICLQSENATLTVRDETQHFAPGEAWWLDHKAPHYGNNDSDISRIHIIFDAVSPLYPMRQTDKELQRDLVKQVLNMGKVFEKND